MRAWLAIVLVLLAAPLAGASGPAEIRAGDGVFAPSLVHVETREPVLFTNADDRPHTVTSVWDDGKSVNVVLRPGQSLRVTFEQPGTYVLRCTPHSTVDGGAAHGMVATVEVAGAASSSQLPPRAAPEILAGVAFIAVTFIALGGGYGWTRLRTRR